jgi:hypothetical protein
MAMTTKRHASTGRPPRTECRLFPASGQPVPAGARARAGSYATGENARRRLSRERRLVDRITVRALRAGLRPDPNDVAAVGDLVRMAGGDAQLLARALHRITPRLRLEPDADTGARTSAILRRALDTATQVSHDAVVTSEMQRQATHLRKEI